MLILLLQGW